MIWSKNWIRTKIGEIVVGCWSEVVVAFSSTVSGMRLRLQKVPRTERENRIPDTTVDDDADDWVCSPSPPGTIVAPACKRKLNVILGAGKDVYSVGFEEREEGWFLLLHVLPVLLLDRVGVQYHRVWRSLQLKVTLNALHAPLAMPSQKLRIRMASKQASNEGAMHGDGWRLAELLDFRLLEQYSRTEFENYECMVWIVAACVEMRQLWSDDS